jgi:hypothetical protein
MHRKTGKKWRTDKCGRCGEAHSGYSGKLGRNDVEYVVCGTTNKKMTVSGTGSTGNSFAFPTVWVEEPTENEQPQVLGIDCSESVSDLSTVSVVEVCSFHISWVGKCNNLQPCKEHSHLRCVSCGEPAVRSCDETGQFVCGAALCNDCEHLIFPDGTNGGVGFNQSELPEGFTSNHIKPIEQKFTPWYQRCLKGTLEIVNSSADRQRVYCQLGNTQHTFDLILDNSLLKEALDGKAIEFALLLENGIKVASFLRYLD